MASQKFSSYANALPVASETTTNTELVGIESNGPTAQAYPVATANTAGTIVARDGSGNFAGATVTATHLATDTSTTPTIAAGPAAGTTPTTLTISGYDSMCTVTMQPGSGQSSGAYFTVTYQTPFAKAPAVVPIPQNQTTAQQSGGSNIAPYVSNVTAEGFSLHSGGNFLSALALYSWTFLSIG